MVTTFKKLSKSVVQGMIRSLLGEGRLSTKFLDKTVSNHGKCVRNKKGCRQGWSGLIFAQERKVDLGESIVVFMIKTFDSSILKNILPLV